MNVPVLADKQERIYINFCRTCQKWWIIGMDAERERERERESGKSMLSVQLDDDAFVSVMVTFIGLVGRVFVNGLGDLGSIPGRVIPKTLKMVLDTSLLNTLHYKVHIKGEVEQSREGVALSHTPRCSSYWKGSLWVALN